MALISIFTETIWPCIREALDHLVRTRKDSPSGAVRSGLNFSIVLCSACYLEGVLETILRALLDCRRSTFATVTIDEFEIRRAMNLFYARLEDDLSVRIGRSVGAAGYDEMFELLTGQRLSNVGQVKPLWEGVTVLFNFRNVLGHGREVRVRHSSGASIEGGFREEFPGSYRVVEEYLRKLELLDRRFVDAHSEYLFLSDAIADHFWCLAKEFPNAVVSALPGAEQVACRSALESRGAGDAT